MAASMAAHTLAENLSWGWRPSMLWVPAKVQQQRRRRQQKQQRRRQTPAAAAAGPKLCCAKVTCPAFTNTQGAQHHSADTGTDILWHACWAHMGWQGLQPTQNLPRLQYILMVMICCAIVGWCQHTAEINGCKALMGSICCPALSKALTVNLVPDAAHCNSGVVCLLRLLLACPCAPVLQLNTHRSQHGQDAYESACIGWPLEASLFPNMPA